MAETLINAGEHVTRDGSRAVVTDTGCFAYGYVLMNGQRREEFWMLDTGCSVGRGKAHRWDLQMPQSAKDMAADMGGGATD